MAKKSVNQESIKSQATQTSPTNTKLGLAFLTATSDNLLESTPSFVGQKSDLLGIDGMNELLTFNGDWFIVVNNAAQFKTAQIQKALSQIEFNNDNKYFLLSGIKENGAVNQFFTGYYSHKDAQFGIILHREILLRLLALNPDVQTTDNLVFFLSKTCGIEVIVNVEQKEIPKKPIADIFKNRFQSAVHFYGKQLKNYWYLAFVVLTLGFTLFITQTSKKAGISGDEFVQYEYSKLIANYKLKSFGLNIPVDTNLLKGQKMVTLARLYPTEGVNVATLEDPDRLMHLYGSSFDTFTTVLAHVLGVNDIMDFRHWWNAIFGMLTVVFAALIIRRLTKGSWMWATFGIILLYCVPRFFGESLNNPKDVPFALGYVMSIYYAFKFFSGFPNVRWSTFIGLILGTALGISIRIGGILSIAIIAMYMALKFIQSIGLAQFISLKWKNALTWIKWVAVFGIASYILGVYVWPYGWKAPIDNAMSALDAFTNYQVSLRQLFEGKLFDSDNLPSHYLTKYIWITLPIGVIGGLFLYILLTLIKRKQFTIEEFLILFTAVFPIFYIYIQHSSVYGGLRHVLFTLPSFVILGVLGYYKLQSFLKLKFPVAGVLAVLTALLPGSFIAKNTNLSYVYFNELAGGVEGAYGEYEMDYYLASLRPSCEWLIENEIRKHPEKQYQLVSYGMDQVKYYMRNEKNVKVGFSRFDDKADKKWDYALFYNAYFDQSRLKSGAFPGKNSVFEPTVSGKPMGCVIKRKSFDDYEGIKLANAGKSDSAIVILKKSLKVDPESYEVLFYLSNAYANIGNIDSAIVYCKQSLVYHPEYNRSMFALFQFYLNQNKYKEGEEIMDRYIDLRPKDPEGYLMKGQALMMSKNFNGAIDMASKAVALNPLESRNYQLGAQCYQYLKDDLNFKQWYTAAMLRNAKSADQQQQSMDAIGIIYEGITGEAIDFQKYMK
jgi:tetratricopeptide (TPR) repeat protein